MIEPYLVGRATYMTDLQTLTVFIEKLRKLPRVFIQAHDFPDHDAIASAWALSYLLRTHNIESAIVYNGIIDRISLCNLINWLKIPVIHCSKAELGFADKIITVDGCIGEKNVIDLIGQEIAVIDHHQVTAPPGLLFEDIRPNYGATATIISEYFDLLKIEMPSEIATALQVGLNVDTAGLTRGFCEADITAFVKFHARADSDLVNKICRNSLELVDLELFQNASSRVQVEHRIGWVLLDVDCPKNMLGILGDFLLCVNEIDVVLVAAVIRQNIQLSLRSECPKVNVGLVSRQILNDTKMGFGGGHAHMAGGLILSDYKNEFFSGDDYHFAPFIECFHQLRQEKCSE